MGFFDVGDGEGGTPEDRIAIICIVAFAFCWIPIFVIWKCINVMRRKEDDAEVGNFPVTTHNSDPEKNPYHPAPQPKKRGQSSAGDEGSAASTRDGERRLLRDGQSRASRDVARQASRDDHGAGDTANRDNLDNDQPAQRSDNREAGEPSRS